MSTQKIERKIGVCRLTGIQGNLLSVHLMPSAHTFLSESAEPQVDTAFAETLTRTPVIWQDDELCVAQGVDILQSIDTAAIKQLRHHRLIWSGFENDAPFSEGELIKLNASTSARMVSLGTADWLRLFLLSMVWRAAASTQPEFGTLRISPTDLEELRLRIVKKDPGDARHYPIVLYQIVNRGLPTNQRPVMEQSPLKVAGADGSVNVPYVRLHLDGMIAHVYLARDIPLHEDVLGLFVGIGSESIVFAKESEGSRAPVGTM